MRTEQGMVCPQVPSAMTHPTATADGRICPPLHPDTAIARQGGTGGHLSGHPWVSKHSRGRVISGPAPQGTAAADVRTGRRTSSSSIQRGLWPQSQPHTQRQWANLEPAACCSGRTGDPHTPWL